MTTWRRSCVIFVPCSPNPGSSNRIGKPRLEFGTVAHKKELTHPKRWRITLIATVGNQISYCDLCGAPLESAAAVPGCLNCLLLGGPHDCSPATRNFQHYEICLREDDITFDELGRGAMGITYRALDSNLGSLVALKVISARYSGDAKARERFQREARAAAQLRNPHVANVFHFGETATGQCFYAMELIEGGTLEARVRRDGPLTVSMALEVATQVARALLAAQAHGLVHRDLKPSNLMLVGEDPAGTDAFHVKVIDFGLAKAVTAIAGNAADARHGFSGTPEFASPEQFRGDETALDVRSDIYSLGATLWYLLCGQSPLADRVLGEASNEPLPFHRLIAAKVPERVIDLLRSMLATDPAKRPQSAQELLGALQRCRTALESHSRRRTQLRLSLAALGLLFVGALTLLSYLSPRQRIGGLAPPTALPGISAQNITVYTQVAQELMERINAADYPGIEGLFNAEMAKQLPLEEAKSFFEGVTQQYGKLQRLAEGQRLGGFLVVFPAHFERGELDLQIALDLESKIAGLFLKPHSAQDIAAYRAAAQKLMDCINAADYPGIEALFNAEMVEELPLDRTKSVFEGVTQQYGKLQKLDEGRRFGVAVIFPAHFERGILDLQIALDLESKIAGLFLKPHFAKDITAHRVVAQKLMDRVNAADYSSMELLFNAEMVRFLPLDKARSFFEDQKQQCGNFQKLDEGQRLSGAAVVFRTHFEHCVADLQITLDPEGRIAGFVLRQRQ